MSWGPKVDRRVSSDRRFVYERSQKRYSEDKSTEAGDMLIHNIATNS